MSKNIKSIQDPRLKLDILNPDDVQQIHEATLQIIANTGVRFPSKRALAIWEKYGAQVDHDTMVVKAPRELIEEAIQLCPPDFTLAARDPAARSATGWQSCLHRHRWLRRANYRPEQR